MISARRCLSPPPLWRQVPPRPSRPCARPFVTKLYGRRRGYGWLLHYCSGHRLGLANLNGFVVAPPVQYGLAGPRRRTSPVKDVGEPDAGNPPQLLNSAKSALSVSPMVPAKGHDLRRQVKSV